MEIEYPIIFFPRYFWHGEASGQIHTDHNTAAFLAKGARVLFMNPIPLKFLCRYPGFFKKHYLNKSKFQSEFSPISFHDFVVPCETRFLWDGFGLNFLFAKTAVHGVRRKYKIEKFLLWISCPSQYQLVGNLGELLSVYQCSDDPVQSALSGILQNKIEQKENDLVRKVDVVFCTSPKLGEVRKKFNPRTYLVPNGVDPEKYLRHPHENISTQPAEMTAIPYPRIGFVGTLNERLDWTLLEELSARFPSYSFVFIGKIPPTVFPNIKKTIEKFFNLKNVFFLGYKPTDTIPRYLRYLSVGIIPYCKTPYMDSVFPIKLYDYLAASLPVVTSDLLSCYELQDIVYLAKNSTEFSEKIQLAVSKGPPTTISGKQILQEHSWACRVEAMKEKIELRLRERTTGVNLHPSC